MKKKRLPSTKETEKEMLFTESLSVQESVQSQPNDDEPKVELYVKEVIDVNIKIEVLKKGEYTGADTLHCTDVKIEQRPEHLHTIQKVMKNEQFLHEIVEKIKRESMKEQI